MINPSSIAEQMMYATIILKSGDHQATGFIYATPNNNLVVISNRHFAEKTSDIDFTKTQLSDSLESEFHLDDGTNLKVNGPVTWYLHPTEDLAFFNLGPWLNPISQVIAPKKFFYRNVDQSIIPAPSTMSGLTMNESVTMVGYPSGRYDSVNNYPLFRYGRTSSHPDVDFEGKKIGVIDVPCLPGSSGSPIFILNEEAYHRKNGNVTVGNRVMLLGIAVAMPTRLNKVMLIQKDPTTGNYKTDTKGNLIVQSTDLVIEDDLSLGLYIKSSELLGFNPIFTSLGL